MFAGGFTLDAAEAVLAFDGIRELDVIDGIAEVVDKSMVEALADRNGDLRYRLLETMRQFGRDVGDRRELDKAEARLIEHYAAWAEHAAEQLGTRLGAVWADRVAVELDNLREVFRLAIADASTDPAARIAVVLCDWSTRYVVSEPTAWAAELCDLMTDRHPMRNDVYAAALDGLRQRGDRDRARQLMDDLRRLEPSKLSVICLHKIAIASWMVDGDVSAAVEFHDRAIAEASHTGDQLLEANAHATLSMAQDAFDRDLAERSARRALEIGRSIGAPWSIAQGLLALSGVYVHTDQERALPLIDEMIEIAERSNDRWSRATGSRIRAHALSRAGHVTEASATFAHAIELNGVGDFGELLWYTVLNVIEHLVRINRPSTAAIALGAFEGAPSASSDNLVQTAVGRLTSRLSEQLGEAEIDASNARGREMPLAQFLHLLSAELEEHAAGESR